MKDDLSHPAALPVVRTFTWTDFPAVVALWQITDRGTLSEVELAATLEHGPDLMVVADQHEAGLVGVVLGTFDGRRGWIHRLAVHPDHRGAGLASALVADLEGRLHQRGAMRVNLLVMPDNAEALTFWQRRGYLTCPDVLCTKALPASELPR